MKNKNIKKSKPEEEEAFKSFLETPSKKIMFNTTTGDLEVKPESAQNKNDVVVDQIYKDGFFCNKIAA